MKAILKLEELAMLIASIYGLWLLQAGWWWYIAIAIAPDISMLGYLIGNKAGAICYNLAHHKGLAILFILSGYYLGSRGWEITGLILLGHSSLDRMLGYGLKLEQGFKYTHLGIIGKDK